MQQFLEAVVKRRYYPIKLARMSQKGDINSTTKFPKTIEPTAAIDPIVDCAVFPTEKIHQVSKSATRPRRTEDFFELENRLSKEADWVVEGLPAESASVAKFRVMLLLMDQDILMRETRVRHEGEIAMERALSQFKRLQPVDNKCQQKIHALCHFHASEMANVQQR